MEDLLLSTIEITINECTLKKMHLLSGANDLSGQGHGLMSVFSFSVNGLRFILSRGLCSRFHLYKKSLKPFYFRHKLSHVRHTA